MLVKDQKKDTRSLDNYRPISLTNTIYKVYASLLQRRLVCFFDDDIRDRQFGFRPNRSTTQPTHIMRRIIEVRERQSETLHALFLDWSKAFDSVSFAAIEKAVHYMGVRRRSFAPLWPSTTIRGLRLGIQVMSLASVPKPEDSDRVAHFLHIYLDLSYRIFSRMWKKPTVSNLEKSQASFRPMAQYGIWSTQTTQSCLEILPTI